MSNSESKDKQGASATCEKQKRKQTSRTLLHSTANYTKHTPLRTCIVCRSKLDKSDLLRIVRLNDGKSIVCDTTQKLQARGVYVCKSQGCLDKLVKQKSLNRAFAANIPNEIYSNIISTAKQDCEK